MTEDSIWKKEMLDVGFHSDVQRRGLIKWINGVLVVLLLLSVVGNSIQWRKQSIREEEHTKEIIKSQAKTDDLNAKYLDVFIRMLDRQDASNQKIDTAIILLNSAIKSN